MEKLLIIYAAFLLLGLCIYFVIPKNQRYLVLLVLSVISVFAYSKFLSLFMIATVCSIFGAGLLMNKLDDDVAKIIAKENPEKEAKKLLKQKFKKKKKWVVAITIIFNLGILAVLKYSKFFASIFEGFFSWFNLTTSLPILKIGLPIGISYYTLTSIGYIVDVYRGKYKAERNICKVALFVCYFPHLYEGPFAKYDELGSQLFEGHDFDFKRIYKGILLIVWGLLKKIVIADRLAIIVSGVFSGYKELTGISIVLGIICFTFQLYAEFSGLIDIASGISECFGIKLAKNFEQPFYSQTVGEFWRRWHISLGVWFKEYIFYPISMSKGMMKLNKKMHGKVNQFWELFIPSMIALFVVWFSNGLWHGAEWKYVFYGLYYYVLMMLSMCLEPLHNKFYEKTKIDKDKKILKILRVTRTFILVNIGMLLFRASDVKTALSMLGSIFAGGANNLLSISGVDTGEILASILGIAFILVIDIIREHKIDIREKISNQNLFVSLGVIALLCFIIIIFGAYGNGYLPPDPIYGGF